MWKNAKAIFDGSLDTDPVRLTLIQSVVVMFLAVTMAAGLYLLIGVYFPNIWYQIFAALFISAILAPIFLYPSFRTSHRLRLANGIIRRQAFTDHLTKLPNSFALAEELQDRLNRQGQPRGLAVHFVDVDRLKQVNDSLGHDIGDAALNAVAANLCGSVGGQDFVARFGGDEFVVVQDGVSTESEALEYALRIRESVSTSYDLDGHLVVVGITVGTAMAPLHGDDPNQILKAADLALYRAKARGTMGELFTPQMATMANRRRDLEVGLVTAIANGQLSLLFQPIVQRKHPQRIVAFEALLRWTLPDGTTISPTEFVPVAERTGAIVEIGQWALRQACLECSNWPAPARVTVNVSPVQFFRSDLVAIIRQTLADTQLAPDRLELEITETVLISDTTFVDPILNELREMGIRIALDDFGSGYCGLHYLRQFTIDKIKVDKTIIDEACSSEKALNILRGVSKIASEIGMTVTVEGVDSQEKAALLNQEKCADEVQGFFYSRPVPADLVPPMLQRASRNKYNRAVLPFERPR
ncbi:bifunctional diguanylate cyclase/phosphodiesterase [Mesorhizobium sp.]|uniref:putative bifunctional diguanylate cyclase/phosphodiesterase n=1 Tax=Mesorhizobium sp. TaxID=1871066 RepID=UPI000FE6FDCA|nr:bifunctional diguanylate cyclase/phosphodiesterase [Mesorhizobium sp.]RWI36114.1 MAG: bifunctional diguanylate cyclase/phosphodiesterase [Mesorhizobium sp.]